MIVVRTVLHAYFGQAGEVATELARMTSQMSNELGASGRWRVMTDLSGQFDSVVQEVEVPSMADWEQARGRLFQTQALRESFGRIQALVIEGHNELWNIEAAG